MSTPAKPSRQTAKSAARDGGNRYERKFVFDNQARTEIERMLLLNPAFFREIFHERQVNNIYLDTIGKKHFWESVEGATRRVKVRIRWYGTTFGEVQNPNLEFKYKDGLAVYKETLPVSEFSLDTGTDLRFLPALLRELPLPDDRRSELLSMRPVLLNCYRRKYFLSADAMHRVTIDDRLHSWRLRTVLNAFLDRTRDSRHVILELKYLIEKSELADAIAGRWPVRMTRWSKYVNGLAPELEPWI